MTHWEELGLGKNWALGRTGPWEELGAERRFKQVSERRTPEMHHHQRRGTEVDGSRVPGGNVNSDVRSQTSGASVSVQAEQIAAVG